MQYGQFCPIAKAAEILGERWTILILRELLMGARRFGELQRGLGDISPALLSQRLRSLERDGLVVRRRAPALRQHEYLPTEAARALLPTLLSLGEWGLLWARNNVLDAELDINLLLLYLERSIDPAQLLGREVVIKLRFADLRDQKDFWLVVRDDRVELCLVDPRRDVDVFVEGAITTVHDVYMGDRSFRAAVDRGDLSINGDPALVRSFGRWFKPSLFAGAPRVPWPQAPTAA